MSLRPTRLTKALAWAALGLPALCGAGDRSALAVLEKALASQRSFHAVIVQARTGPPGRPVMLVKIQVVPAKGTKATVLQPISNQGFVSMDDGREMRVFDPDSDVVLVQPSPNLFLPSTAWRMSRIKENYTVTFGARQTVAGRNGREILMKPRHSGMPERRLIVDDEKRLILRYTIVPAGQPEVVFSDVRSVIFDVAEASEDFRLPPAADSRRVSRTQGPETVRDAADALEKTGIKLPAPSGLPAGFGVHTIHAVGRGGEKYLAFRTSDGMSFVTVYVRKDRPGGRERRELGSSRVVDGIRISAVGMPGEPVPKQVLSEIVERFAQALA